MNKTCQNCGNSYEAPPSIKPKYCSARCYHDSKPKSTTISCQVCGKQAKSYPSRPRKFCSKSCARTAANLTDQNPALHRDVSGENNPMFGKGLFGPSNPNYGKRKDSHRNWKGGKKTRKDGYVFVVAPPDHPHPAYVKPSGTAYILEHRLVMERMIGRYLQPEEVVHHADEDPSNNDPSNLRLYATQAAHLKDAHSAESSA